MASRARSGSSGSEFSRVIKFAGAPGRAGCGMEVSLCWAALGCFALLPLMYPVLGTPQIVRGLGPPPGYWRRRLLLNLLENNLGMVLAAGLAAAVAVLTGRGDPAGWHLRPVAAIVCASYGGGVLVLTPRDWWHAIPALGALGCYAAAWLLA